MKRFSLLFLMIVAVAAFGQEGMEATDEMMAPDTAMTDTMAMDEMMMTEEAPMEEMPMEDSGDALEAMLAEEGTMETEVTSGSAMIGYTVGIDAGYPVYLHGGLGTSYPTAGPALGITLNTPFGAAIGPFEIGFGAQVGMYKFTNDDSNAEISGIYALATANTSIVETANGTVSMQIGAGYYGSSIGFTAGAAFDYAVPNIPLVVRPYIRGNGTLDSGAGVSEGESASYAWLNIGLMLSYDISTLF